MCKKLIYSKGSDTEVFENSFTLFSNVFSLYCIVLAFTNVMVVKKKMYASKLNKHHKFISFYYPFIMESS